MARAYTHNPKSDLNLIAGHSPGRGAIWRECPCCGEQRMSIEYTRDSRKKKYAKHCKSCCNWLWLLRQVFGKSHPSGTPPKKGVYTSRPNKPARELWAAWHGAAP